MESMQDKIPDYLAGRLDPEANKAFETVLATDSELRQEVAEHRKVADMLERERRLAAKRKMVEGWLEQGQQDTIAGPEPSVDANRVSPIQLIFRYWWIGAAAAAIIGLIYFMPSWLNQTSPELRQLAQNNYSLDEYLGPAGIDAEIYLEGFNLFDNKQYQQAIDTWAELSPEDGKYFVNALYLTGHAFLNLQDGPNYRAAEQRFEEVLSNLDTMEVWILLPNQENRKIEREDVEWYLALSHLGLGKKNQAVSLLETLTPSGRYQAKATQLLEAIRQL